MKEALLYFLRELQDPYLLSILLELEDKSDNSIMDEIKEAYEDGEVQNEAFKHFKNIPLDMEIGIHGIYLFEEDDIEDITPKFEVKQQLLMLDCSGDTYLIQLPIKIM
jgi:hypothetical protein